MDDAISKRRLVNPPEGCMWVAVGPANQIKPLPRAAHSADVDDPLQELLPAVRDDHGPDWRIEVVPFCEMPNLPTVRYWFADGAVHAGPDADKAKLHVRLQRDAKLRAEVDPIVSNPLRWQALSRRKQRAWETYRQQLLDVPDGDVFDPDWPDWQSIYDGLSDEPVEGQGDLPAAALAMMLPDETPRDASKRLTPILIEEKAELQRVRALTGVTDPREAEVDQLLGLFARLGES